MTDKSTSGNPDATQESGEAGLTELDLVQGLVAQMADEETESREPEEEAEEEVPEDESTESTEEEGDSTDEEEDTEDEEESEETEEDDVLSQIDLDALTDEQKAELAQQLGSGAGKELGKLRRENRTKDEQIAQLEAEIKESLSKVLPSDNYFSNVTDLEALKEQEEQINANIAGIRKFLRSGDDYIEVGDKEVDRETVDGWLDVYLQQKEDLPKQRQRLKELASVKDTASKEMETAKTELNWLDDEDSAQFKKFKKLKADSDFDLIQRISPLLSAKLERIMAHAINSMSGSTAPKKKLKLPLKGAKAVSGKLGSANSSKPSNSKSKKVDAARKRILSGEGSEEDIIAAAFNL